MKRRLMKLCSVLALAVLVWALLDWAVWSATFRPDAAACAAQGHQGACWGVVVAKARPILLGFYPFDAQWRPVAALVLMAAASAGAAWALLRRGRAGQALWGLGAAMLGALALLRGGWSGGAVVPSDQWGGLPLTLVLFVGSGLASVPLAVALALGRRASQPWISRACTVVIEVVRGVPLVTLLFACAYLLPAWLPETWRVPLIWRGGLALTLFSAVYLAEVLRGGLQTVPREQSEAAAILGLNWWQTQHRIVLPQAARAVLPATVSHAIGLLKDSSLVTIIGLHELTGGLSLSLGGDPLWRPYYLEAYLFVGALYALMCVALSRLGRALEQRWVNTTAA